MIMNLNVKQLALTGLMAAVICVLGPLALSIPVSPVPISLGTLAIYFVASVAGMKTGTLSVVIYILLGLAGVPVFTGFTGGVGKLFGPTGGYIIGYLFMALICGFFAAKFGRQLPGYDPWYCHLLPVRDNLAGISDGYDVSSGAGRRRITLYRRRSSEIGSGHGVRNTDS